MKNQLTDKAKAWIAVIFLLLFLGLSVFFWLVISPVHAFWHWIGLYLLEWGMRAKRGDYAAPGYSFLRETYFSRLKKAETDKKGEITPTYITNIADWLVKDMLKCHAGDYSSVGTKENYQRLIYQYIDAKQSDDMKVYKDLMRRKITTENKIYGIIYNCAILKERYSRSAAEYLRKSYPQFEFLPSTYLKDIEKLAPIKIKLEIDLERIDKQLTKQAESETKESISAEQKYNQLSDLLFEINKNEGVKYDLNTMTVLELARGEYRLQEHIKRLKKQASINNGR